MARRTGTKNELVKCEYCGEMYSVTYKHCPFCNEDGTGRWDDPETEEVYYDDYEPPARGGKRLASSGRGSHRGGGGGPSVGRIVGLVLSLALIVAAACIVISIVRTLTGGKKPPAESASPVPTAPVESLTPESTDPTLSSQEPGDPTQQDPEPTTPIQQIPVPSSPVVPTVDVTAPTDFTLNREDFTFDAVGQVFQMKATFIPADAKAEVNWKSSDPNIASVSWNGMVTAVSRGTVTLTATVDGVGERKCIVRCNFDGTAAPAASAQPSGGNDSSSTSTSSTSLTLSREDFTLSKPGESWRLVVSGTSSAVTWASSNSEVANVDASGKVTAVSKGTCNVTATVDGVTLKCIVRCNWTETEE